MKKINGNNQTIVISRTDSIGDVMLTLPICSWLKEHFPTAKIIFLGKSYTEPIVSCYQDVDEFANWDEIKDLPSGQKIEQFRSFDADTFIHVFPNREIASLAKKAKVKNRIGTSHRSFHLLTCNYRLSFTRKRSSKHEAQLNHHLLEPFGLEKLPELSDVIEKTNRFVAPQVDLPKFLSDSLSNAKKTCILHPKSQGSAKEWPMEKYVELTNQLIEKDYTVYFTGTEKEGEQFRSELPKSKNCIDTTGKLTLSELIAFISRVDNLVACSTGPLHIAGFLGVNTIGLFSPRKPIHPGRWQALGKHINILVFDEDCKTCADKKSCDCIENIEVERVVERIV